MRWPWLIGIGECIYTAIFFLFHPTGIIATPLSYAVLVPAAFVHGHPVFYHRIATQAHDDVPFDVALTQTLREVRKERLAKQLNTPREQLAEAVFSDDAVQSSAYQRLQNVVDKLTQQSMPFTDAARYFSEDTSAFDGGDLGVLLYSDLPLWLAPALVSARAGDVTDIIESPFAFWVIRISETGGSGEGSWLRLRGIAINKYTLEEVIQKDIDNHPALVLVW